MNIIRKGAAAILRSYFIANFDLDELMNELEEDKGLDEILGEETKEEFLRDYDEVDMFVEGQGIREFVLVYFALAPITALMMIFNKIVKRYISKHK